MHRIRLMAGENALSPRTHIDASAYQSYIAEADRSWVAEAEGEIIGFSIVDLENSSIRALFVAPTAEGQGVGTIILDQLLKVCRSRKLLNLSLSTGAGTRAEVFYRSKGFRSDSSDKGEEVELRLTL